MGPSMPAVPTPADVAARYRPRAAAKRGAIAGVTEEMIFELVDAFYERARSDPTLGPIYERVIGDHWAAHIVEMCDFWSAVMFGTGWFSGELVEAHLRIRELRPTHFGRWLYLFARTAHEVCPPLAAALFIATAETIAEDLQAAMAAAQPARRPPPGQADAEDPKERTG
jgi:hemoglobin